MSSDEDRQARSFLREGNGPATELDNCEGEVNDGYDVIVVGSGYGGAVASCRLAQAEVLRVCVLEKGRRWEPEDFPNSFLQVLRQTQLNCPWGSWGKPNFLFQFTIDGDCLAVTGAGLGGGSLINAGVIASTPQRTLRDPRWPKEWREDWSTYETIAESMAEAETVPHDFPKKKVMDIIRHELEDADLEDLPQSASTLKDKRVNLSIRFKDGTNIAGVKQSGCIACGNCLNGCRYDSKNSTDKNYIALAVQAGAEVRTESRVLFIAQSPDKPGLCSKGVCSAASWLCDTSNTTISTPFQKNSKIHESDPAAVGGGRTRRWRVYLDEINYLSADFVVLAAGVLGTTEILLRSRERGLNLSERVGYGVSCNGNNVGYASGSRAPTGGVGMDSKEFAEVKPCKRPGPAICNSYTSSAGYTVQGATAPKNYPYVFFRACSLADSTIKMGLLPSLLDILWQQLKVWMHTTDSKMLCLNMMGYDDADGQIYLDKATGRVRFVAPRDNDMVKKMSACRRLATRMRAEFFACSFRSMSVHLLGGCNAAADPKSGVVNPDGQVFDPSASPDATPLHVGSRKRTFDTQNLIIRFESLHRQKETNIIEESGLKDGKLQSVISAELEERATVYGGLYVCDGSLIPCAVGVNPSFTIATVAERVASAIVQDAVGYVRKRKEIHRMLQQKFIATNLTSDNYSCVESKHPLAHESVHKIIPGSRLHLDNLCLSSTVRTNESTDSLSLPRPGPPQKVGMVHEAPVTVRETLRGHLGGIPCSLHVIMHMGVVDTDSQQPSCPSHDVDPSTYNRSPSPRNFEASHRLLRGRVGGRMLVPKLDAEVLHVVDGSVDMCWVDPRTPYTHYMHYHLHLVSASGAKYFLSGEKVMHPFLGGVWAWQESTTLHVKLRKITEGRTTSNVTQPLRQQGERTYFPVLEGDLRVSVYELLKSMVQLRGSCKLEFVKLLLGSFVTTYFLSCPRVLLPRNQGSVVQRRAQRHKSPTAPYPRHVLHEFSTGDGVEISLQQWPCLRSALGRASSNVVLLLNGHSTESYWLPTEPTDLVRTLLQNGYEPWILNSRIHPDYTTNSPLNFDIMAQYDIPAAVTKIEEIREDQVKLPLHVVAHCVGGLMIHMAILGGYLPVSKVASILCTNASMFFRVNKLAMVKLMIPLMPVSMAVLGKNTVLNTFDSKGDSFNHRLLRFIARRVPRLECCTMDSCSIFSGVFGNIFWHANVSDSLHAHQVSTTPCTFPLSALPHLRKIILKGHLVHNSGQEVYMPYSKRLALPTTYISGGKELLVTKETGSLAQEFMKMHHPQFLHSHVVVPEFGHNDLLIGEESSTCVFPHILKHLGRVRDGAHVTQQGGFRKVMDWETDREKKRLTLWSVFNLFNIATLFLVVYLFLPIIQ